MHKKYFTTGEIARYCEVDINTVKNWIKANDLEGFKTPSGHFRVARKAFIDFIKNKDLRLTQTILEVIPETLIFY